MADKNWWVGVALGLAGCSPPGDAASDTGDGPGSAGTASTGELPDDGVDAQLECSAHAALDASADELAINAHADAKLGLDLLGALASGNENVLLSPLSLRTGFGQVYAGASGESRAEIETLFGFAALGDRTHDVLGAIAQKLETRNAEETEYEPGLVLDPVNRAFFDIAFEDGVRPDWKQRVQDAYGVCFEYFDMNRDLEATRTHINRWVSHETHERIPDLVKYLPGRVSLVVANALYLRASWATPFDDGATHPATFDTHRGAAVEVEMMHASALSAEYAADESWEAVAIPYSDSRLEMVVVLPKDAHDEGFEAQLDADKLDEIFASMSPAVVDLELPKFDIKSSWALGETLRSLGMNAAFSNAEDFDGIAAGMAPIFEVFHDVAIAVDEKGTEAAAATAVVFGDGSGGLDSPEFTLQVDHTFYVAIRDRDAQTVMFFARIGDPTAAS